MVEKYLTIWRMCIACAGYLSLQTHTNTLSHYVIRIALQQQQLYQSAWMLLVQWTLELRPASVWAQIRVFVDVIPVSAVLYIINFANCYQNGPQKGRNIINFANCYQNGPQKVENNFLVSTLGKWLVFLINYVYYAILFYYEKVR
jgi:hypothetical protein